MTGQIDDRSDNRITHECHAAGFIRNPRVTPPASVKSLVPRLCLGTHCGRGSASRLHSEIHQSAPRGRASKGAQSQAEPGTEENRSRMAASPRWELMSHPFIFPHAAESGKKFPDAVSIFAHDLQKFFQPQALFFRPSNAHSATLPERLAR